MVAWPVGSLSQEAFITKIYDEGRRHHRSLPWRYLEDPYAVLVSEVMLQQTQVSRVLMHWPRWMNAFPTIDALAAASVADVLEHWQGLGYNRRALALKRAVDECSEHFEGQLPTTVEHLMRLPGIGPATAAGVIAFAFDKPAIYLETNVRTVFIHELFPLTEAVHDRELIPLVNSTCPTKGARLWYYSLLDYGSYLKTAVVNPSRRSAHYTRQSSFEGSRRQKRATLVRLVLAQPGITKEELTDSLDTIERAAGRDGVDEVTLQEILSSLIQEGFFQQRGNTYFA